MAIYVPKMTKRNHFIWTDYCTFFCPFWLCKSPSPVIYGKRCIC